MGPPTHPVGVTVGHQRASPPPNFQNLSMIKEDSLDSNNSGGTDLSPKDPLPPSSPTQSLQSPPGGGSGGGPGTGGGGGGVAPLPPPPCGITEEELQRRRDRRRSSGSTDDGEGGGGASKRKQYPQISITDTHGHVVPVPSAEDTSVVTDEPVVQGVEFGDLEGVEDEGQVLKDDIDLDDTTKPPEGFTHPHHGVVPSIIAPGGITSGSPLPGATAAQGNPAGYHPFSAGHTPGAYHPSMPVTYPGLNLAKIPPVADDSSMEVDLDSPDTGMAPLSSLHRAYPPMGLFTPGQYGNLMIDPSQGYDTSALLGALPYSLNQRNVSPIISPCRTPTVMGSAGSSPDMDSRQDAQSSDDPHYIHYNQLSSSPEDESVPAVGSQQGGGPGSTTNGRAPSPRQQRASSTSVLDHLHQLEALNMHNGLHAHAHAQTPTGDMPSDGDATTSPPYTAADLTFSLPVNLSSKKTMSYILKEITQALDQRSPEIAYEHSENCFRLENSRVSMEMEVQAGISERGVRFRKLSGDAWQYNKLCNELLSSMDL